MNKRPHIRQTSGPAGFPAFGRLSRGCRQGRNNDDGLCGRTFIRERNVDPRFTSGGRKGVQSRQRTAGEFHRRAAARQINDAHITPEYAAAKARAEGFGTGLLGGKTFGLGFNGVCTILRFFAFG